MANPFDDGVTLAADNTIAAGHPVGEIAEIVRAYIVDEFLLGAGSIDDDASLLESRILDSTGIVALALYIEMRFGIELDDDDMTTANFDSVRRISAFVARRRAMTGMGDRVLE
jgi:acyl carrier protein